MPKRGENITKRKDGRWEARVIKGYKEDGRAIYKHLYGTTYTEAKIKKNEYLSLMRLMKNDTYNNDCVFNTILSMFLQYKKHQIKESTYACYSNIIDKHIRPNLGMFKVRNITNTMLENFTDEKLKSGRIDNTGGLSKKTVKDILSVLSLVLKYANKIGLMNISEIHFSVPKIPKDEIEIFSVEEEHVLAEFALESHDYQKFGVILTLYTGMRIGELCALKWENIDLENALIYVNYTLTRITNTDQSSEHKTKIVIDSPKTDAGKRVIPIPSFLISKMCSLGEMKKNTDYFLTGTDKYIEPSNYYAKYRKWLRELQVSDHSFHALRHTFATRCIESGCDAKSVSELLGHASVNITLNRYVHSSIELKRVNIERLTDFYKQSILQS